MSLHPAALSESAKQVFDLLCRAPLWRDFYLAGGTGLALQIGNRMSADFDFFSSVNSLDASRREALRRVLSGLGHVEVDADEEGSLRGTLGGVPVSSFRYDYPLLERLVEHAPVKLASPLDIDKRSLYKLTHGGMRW